MISKCKYGWMSVNCGTTSITATSARPVVDVGSDSDVAISEITVDERDPARNAGELEGVSDYYLNFGPLCPKNIPDVKLEYHRQERLTVHDHESPHSHRTTFAQKFPVGFSDPPSPAPATTHTLTHCH